MTALYIVLAVLALIIVLFAVPVKVSARFSFNEKADGEISLQYLFLKLVIFPKAQQEDKPPEKEADKTGGAREEKPKQKRNVKLYLEILKASLSDIKKGVFSILGYIIKHAITIYKLNISADFGLEDAMYTGIAAGALNAAVYNIIGLLDRNMKLKERNVSLIPNFSESEIKAGVYCIIGTNVLHVLALGAIIIKTAVKILFIAWRVKKNEQSGK